MYQKVSFNGYFLTSIAIAIAILFLVDCSPLFAANFSGKLSNGSAASIDGSESFRKSLAAAFQAAITNASAEQALAAKNRLLQGGPEYPSSLTLVDDTVYDDDRQARDRIQLWATPSMLEREKLNRTESGVPIQVEDPLATKREPKWHNACVKRSVFNDTLIKIIIGMQSPHPTLAIEEDRKASGTFIRMENGRPTILATSQRKKLLQAIRPKREVKEAGASLSLLEQQQEQKKQLKQHIASNDNLKDNDNDKNDDGDGDDVDGSSLVVAAADLEQKIGRSRQADSNNKEQQAQPIEALSSFRQPKQNLVFLTSPETHAFSRHIMKRSKEVSGKSRNYYDNNAFASSSPGNLKNSQADQALALVLGRIGTNTTYQLTKVMDKIFVSDVRISWSINCALNNAHSAKKMIGSLIKVMESEIENNNKSMKPDEEQIQQLVENRREWLSNFTDLEVKNEQPQIQVETRKLFANVSHYLQFVAVALEQMLYEQAVWDRQLSISYNDLERATLKMLCEIDTLCQLLQSLKEGKEELVRLMEINKLTDENLHAFESMRKINASSVESIGKRILYSKNLLDSVHFNWLAKNKPNLLHHQQLLQQLNLTSKQHNTSNNSLLPPPTTKANGAWLSSSNLTNSLVSPSMIRIGRYVMPIRERNLKTYSERLVRDKSILENYEKVLSFYETILTNVFV